MRERCGGSWSATTTAALRGVAQLCERRPAKATVFLRVLSRALHHSDAAHVSLALAALTALCRDGCVPFADLQRFVDDAGIVARLGRDGGDGGGDANDCYSDVVGPAVLQALCSCLVEVVDLRGAVAEAQAAMIAPAQHTSPDTISESQAAVQLHEQRCILVARQLWTLTQHHRDIVR